MSKADPSLERRALIFNIQKYNLYDGPGVRTLVFFKGCPLRCLWCSNPEGQLRCFQVLFKKDRCVNCGACVPVCPSRLHSINSAGQHVVTRNAECVGCRKCEDACPKSALSISGEHKSISDIMSIIEEDMPFYQSSQGGVTLGGGEVLMQPEAAINLLAACKQRGLNTAIETCGYARLETIRKVAEVVDLFLYDIKLMDSDGHYRLTGVHNESILENVRWLLENGYNVKVRMPVLKDLNDSDAEFEAVVRVLWPYKDHRNFKGIDVFPYHKMGVNKYAQLDMEYPLQGDPKLDDKDLARIEGCVKRHGIPVTVIRH